MPCGGGGGIVVRACVCFCCCVIINGHQPTIKDPEGNNLEHFQTSGGGGGLNPSRQSKIAKIDGMFNSAERGATGEALLCAKLASVFCYLEMLNSHKRFFLRYLLFL